MKIKYTDFITENMIPELFETSYSWDAWAVTYPLVEIRFDPDYFVTDDDSVNEGLEMVTMTYSPYYNGLDNRIEVFYNDFGHEVIELTEDQTREIENYLNDFLWDKDHENSLDNLLNKAIIEYFDNKPGHYFTPISDTAIAAVRA